MLKVDAKHSMSESRPVIPKLFVISRFPFSMNAQIQCFLCINRIKVFSKYKNQIALFSASLNLVFFKATRPKD